MNITYDGKPCKYGHGMQRYRSSNGCVKCAALARDRYRKADASRNRRLDRDRKRAVHRADPRVKMFTAARERAAAKGLSFTISLDDIVIPTECPLLGTQLKISDARLSPNSPSLDRILNTYGYVPGNVHVVSHRANSLKRDATAAELALLASRLQAAEREALERCCKRPQAAEHRPYPASF